MTTYRVELESPAREVYLVDAGSPEEARARWADGSLVVSEVGIGTVVSVTEEES